jgi:hypothetical protein
MTNGTIADTYRIGGPIVPLVTGTYSSSSALFAGQKSRKPSMPPLKALMAHMAHTFPRHSSGSRNPTLQGRWMMDGTFANT